MLKLTTAKFRFRDTNWKSLRDVSIRLSSLKGDSVSTLQPAYNEVLDLHELENIPTGKYRVQAFSADLQSEEIECNFDGGDRAVDIYLSDKDAPFLRFGKRRLPIVRDEDNYGILLKRELTEAEDETFKSDLKKKGIPTHDKAKRNKSNRSFKFSKGKNKKEQRSVLRSVLEHEFVESVGPVVHEDEEISVFLTGFVYTSFDPAMSGSDVKIFLKDSPFDIAAKIPDGSNLYLLKYKKENDYDLIDAINELAEMDKIVEVEPCSPLYTEPNSIPAVGNMTRFQWNLDLLQMPEVWQVVNDKLGVDSKFGSSDVTVAIVDTGIETNDPYMTPATITTADHPDFSGNVTTPAGGSIKKTYFSFDYALLKQGNYPTGEEANHGTNSAGTATAKATTYGISGVIPNARMMSLRYVVELNGEKLTNWYKHAAGLETNWANNLGGLYLAAQKFPANFPAIGQQAETLLAANQDGFTVEGPATSLFSNSFSVFGVPANEITKATNGFQAVSLLGRQRKGSPMLFASGNDDNSYENKTIFGQDKNVIMVGASILDHLGRETKAHYSNYSADYKNFLDVCAPSNSGGGHYVPFSYSIFSSDMSKQTLLSTPPDPNNYAGVFAADYQLSTTLNVAVAANATTFKIDTASGSVVDIIFYIQDGNKSEIILGSLPVGASPVTVAIKNNYTRAAQNKTHFSHTAGTTVHLLQASASSVNKFTPFFGGTSASTPTVSGIVGLMLSVNAHLSWLEIRQILRDTAIPINLRHRGVSTILSKLDWRQFNPANPFDYPSALPLVDAEGAFISKQPDNTVSVPFNVVAGTLDDANREINVGNNASYAVRQSVLVGWETTLQNAAATGSATIKVKDGRGFKVGQQIRIGRNPETALIKVGASEIDVTSTDGFKVGDHILINGSAAQINNFRTNLVKVAGTTVNNGSCSGIQLSAAFALPGGVDPVGVLVKIDPAFQTEQVGITNIAFDNGGASATSNQEEPATLTLSTATTASVTYAVGTIVRNIDSELRVIVDKIGADKIVLDKPEFTRTAVDFFVTKGRMADYNHAFGFGRMDALKAVKAARDYTYTDVDLYLRNNLTDDGKNENNDPIQSPDIWVRKQADLDLAVENNGLELNQNLDLTIPKLTSFDGTGTDDLEVDTYYTGTVADVITYVIRIDDATHYTYMKTVGLNAPAPSASILIPAAFTELEAGSGVRIKFGAGTHDVGDEWTIVIRPAKRNIYARVWNAGIKASYNKAKKLNSKDVNHVRFSLCTKSDKNLQLGNFVLNNKHVAFDLSTGNEGAIILNEGVDNFSTPIAGKGASEHHQLFSMQWPDKALIRSVVTPLLPPRNNFDGANNANATTFGSKRVFVLGEVLPHDGVVMNGATITDGLSPKTNNNISFREVGFYNATFHKTGNIGLPPSLIQIENTAIQKAVSIDLKALVGTFKKKNIHVLFKRELFTPGSSPQVAEYYYNSTSTMFEFKNPMLPNTTYDQSWITTAPNITGVVTDPVIQTVFETTVEASTTTSKISITVKVYNEEGEFELYSEAHQIIVTTPATVSPESTTGAAGTTKVQEVLFYTQADLIAPGQTAAMAYGPLSASQFNTTNLFNSTGAMNPWAYAVADGVVFAQDTVDGLSGMNATVNLILKPYDQGVIEGLKVKYFVYRGVLKSELVANATDLNIASVGTIDLVKNAVESYELLYKKINNVATVPVGEVVGIESLGLDLVTQPDGTDLSAGFRGRGDNQPVPIKKGQTLGHFHGTAGANSFGFDIILEDPNLRPVLGDVRKKQNIIAYTATGATRESELTARSQVLGYLDPCAFYGMHAIGGVVKTNLEGGGSPSLVEYKAGDDNVYAKLLSPYFINKNKIYLDVRGAQDKTYNFSNVIGNENIGMAFGDETTAAMPSYFTSSWPLMIFQGTSANFTGVNQSYKKEVMQIRVFLPGKASSSISIYLSSGKPYESKLKSLAKPVNGKKRKFKIDTDAMGKAESPIDLGAVNYPPDMQNPATTLVSGYLRLKYLNNIGADAQDQGSVFPRTYDFDNVFGPEPEFFANTKNTQMMFVSWDPYIDAGNSLGFQGIVDTGVAKDSGRTTFYAVPKSTIQNLRGENTEFKRLIGGSFDQNFFDAIVGNALPGLHKRKREITIGGNPLNYLDIVSDEVIGAEIGSPLNLMGISVTDTELASLKTNIASLDQTIHPAVLNIRSKTSALDDNGNGYLKAEIGFAGLNSAGAYTQLTETVDVYGSSGTFLCSSAAASIEVNPAIETWKDITWDKNNSGSPQVYRRLIVDVDRETSINHKVEWELYNDQGIVQTYTGTPVDAWGRTGIVNAGDQIILPAGTRVIVLGRRTLGGGANYKGNYSFYRVICWFRNEYREGFVPEYAVLGENPKERVNAQDLQYLSDLMIAESFFNDIAFELKIVEDIAIDGNASSTAPKLWAQILKNKLRWQQIQQNVQTQGNVLMPAYRTEIQNLVSGSDNKFRTDRKTMHADFGRFRKLPMFQELKEFDEYLIVSLDPFGEVYKELRKSGYTTYPLLAETLFSEIGEYKGNEGIVNGSLVYDPVNGNVEKLKQEFIALKNFIDTNYLPTDPIRLSNDYLFIEEILDPGNTSNPDIVTLHEAATAIFIGADGWMPASEIEHRFLNSLVPSDQAFGHVDSSTIFSLLVNESNITFGFIPPTYSTWTNLMKMITDTHDSGALKAYEYMKDPTHTIQSIITANGHLNIDPTESLPIIIRRLFLRNPEIGLFYIDEYLTEFGV